MNLEVYGAIIATYIQSNVTKLIRQHFKVQTGNDKKHTVKESQEFPKLKKWNVLECLSQSSQLSINLHLSDAV